MEIAKTVQLGRSQEADVYASLLQQRHHREHVTTISRIQQIGRIAHGVEQFRRGCVPDHATFEKPVTARRRGALGDAESDNRQAHADEKKLAIVSLARGASHHNLSSRKLAVSFT